MTLETTDKSSLISLEGPIDISCAAELKSHLLDALKPNKATSVSLEKVTCMDVTSIQLLWAAEREARGAGIPFTLIGRLPEPICATVREAGFDLFPLFAAVTLHSGTDK